MNRYFFIGGLIGFALLFAISVASGSNIHAVLRNAMVGCLVLAFLFHFYMSRVVRLYMQARMRRIEEARQQEKAREREQERAKV